MDYQDHIDMQENAAIGQEMTRLMQGLLDAAGCDTLAELARDAYKHTSAGVSVSFKPHREMAPEIMTVNDVRFIHFDSIVEGSDAEVSATPLDLYDYAANEDLSPEQALEKLEADYDQALSWVNDEACALWDEANDDLND